jgi:hypothetical protein
MTRLLGLTLIVMLSSACSDDEGPEEQQYQGRWAGTYTNSAQPDLVFQAVLQLTQDEGTITGTLTTSLSTGASRSATVDGEVSGDQLDATFTYTDQCGGTASSTADLLDDTVPPSLTGQYAAVDCLGETTGEFDLVKDE